MSAVGQELQLKNPHVNVCKESSLLYYFYCELKINHFVRRLQRTRLCGVQQES